MDRMSSLPDGILHRILSFVPTFLAIKTSVLSKRWRYIWREAPYISLEGCNEESAYSVNKTLNHHRAQKLLSFHLGFTFDAPWLEFPKGQMMSNNESFIFNKWINYALSRDPENLSLDLFLYHYQKYSFPDIFYVNSSVKRLILVLHTYTSIIPRSSVFWPSLKDLCLDGCNIPDESAAKILSGCPLLESLTLNLCKMLQLLDLSKSMRMRRLEIDHRHTRSGPTMIVAPHIHYLKLETTKRPPCSLHDVSSLQEAKLNLLDFSGDTIADFLYVMDVDVLPKLNNIDNLTLGPMFILALTVAEQRSVSFPMLKITTLTIETGILRYFVPPNAQLRAVPGIAKLLQNSSQLKKLTLNLMKCTTVKEPCVDTYIDSRGMKFEVVPTSSEPKLIALFIELVLGNTKTLEKLVVRLEDKLDADMFEELFQMAQTLSQDFNNVSISLIHNVSDSDFEFPFKLF